LDDYAAAYLSDYEFEATMVSVRQNFIVRRLLSAAPSRIVEIGCGADLLFDLAFNRGLDFRSWTIVEPETAFAEIAEERAKRFSMLSVLTAPVQQVDWEREAVGIADFVIVSSLLHELNDPEDVLASIRPLCRHDTVIHINVPNRGSLHRRLAKAMGLIENTSDLTERNKNLSQKKVFSMGELVDLVGHAGFEIIRTGGYFLKPFTHRQMARLVDQLPIGILDGLEVLGTEFPDIAAEIFVEAKISGIDTSKG
jgi:2-polyprenyl-3-methyl-5-hydroxy-6-metoxy-1,4-benzoquinol methylase